MRRYLVVAALALLPTGCGGSESAEPELVRFKASDGVELEGRSFGGGEVAVILSHMGRLGDAQVGWYPLARYLGERGYWALTYNRRGVCLERGDGCSRGVDHLSESWRDVVGAYRHAKANGATRVVLVGASIGAMSSLFAASRTDVDIDALVEVGGVNNDAGRYAFTRRDVARVEGAKLFVSSEEDRYGGAEAARLWHRWARAPKQLVILGGSDHGTDMLREGKPARARLIGLIVEFLGRYVPPT